MERLYSWIEEKKENAAIMRYISVWYAQVEIANGIVTKIANERTQHQRIYARYQ